MNLKEYVDGLVKYLDENPELADKEVVTSKDDEGNGYNFVHCSPSSGHYDSEDRDFHPTKPLNAVCVN